MEYGILVDTTRCTYCGKCIDACEEKHQGVNPGTFYTDVTLTYPRGKENRALPVSSRCMHCNDSPCVAACQGKALSKLPEGPVIWDEDKCIGCLSCISVCPFDKSLHYASSKAKVFKCDMCYERIFEGLKPACVEICEEYGYYALSFGPFDDILDEGMQRAEELSGILFYPEATHTLMLFKEEEFNKSLMQNVFGFSEVYPSQATVKANVTKYVRLGWIPVAGGLVFYILNWRKNRMEKLVKTKGGGE